MYEAPGVGLAAPQIGINKNIFVFDAGEGPKVAINPKIEDLQGDIIFMEGCLSLPGYYWDIERYEYAKVSCLNENGDETILDYYKLLSIVKSLVKTPSLNLAILLTSKFSVLTS